MFVVVVVVCFLGFLYYLFYGSINDPVVVNTSRRLFIYIDNVIQNDWDELIHKLDFSNCTSKNIENNTVFWISSDMPDFSFIAHKEQDNKFSLSISGSTNGTSKDYFGFNITVPRERMSYWMISSSDSMMGCRATSYAKKLAIICGSTLTRYGMPVLFEK
ncbi:TPA: hypothetical protein JAN57_03245 [Legionella pneumophila]|nr:hypothetical protein [Legionella pneumophila]HAU1656328.1 hypothetical protein [Legionella pneumophila]